MISPSDGHYYLDIDITLSAINKYHKLCYRFLFHSVHFPGYHPNTYGQGLDGYNLLKEANQHTQFGMDGTVKFDNFTCGRIDLMGNIVTKSAPYLYPFVIEFSLIVAAILFVMWLRIGKNPR